MYINRYISIYSNPHGVKVARAELEGGPGEQLLPARKGLVGISPPAARPRRQLDPLENPPEKKVYLTQGFALHTAGERAVLPPAGHRCPIATPPASPKMKEMREYPGFLGTERSKRGGSSLEMKPGARVACQVTVAVVFLVLLVTAIAFAVHAFQPRPQPCARCPFDWIGYRGKCYHFSEAERNWTSSQDNCSALGASLAMFDSVEDLSFTMRYKGISEHWVGLSREGEEQPWKWVNHSRPSHL
ncbi:C-type lectin domain family 2 member D-like isoform X2 [Anser cygnoides]